MKSSPSSSSFTKMTTIDYNNNDGDEDNWHIHRNSMLGLLSSSSITSDLFFGDYNAGGNNYYDDDDNADHRPHNDTEEGEEGFIPAVGENDSFFDEEDVIGYYLSYDQNDHDEAFSTGDGEGDTKPNPYPPPNPTAAAHNNFQTPTATTTVGNSHDHTTATIIKLKRKRSRRDPNKPKGRLTPVLLYSNANRARVKMENPNASFGDVARLLSAEFKSLSSEDAALWRRASEEDKARYDREMKIFLSSPVPLRRPPLPPAVQVSGSIESVSSSHNSDNGSVDCTASNHHDGDGALADIVDDEKERDVVATTPRAKWSKKTKGSAYPNHRRHMGALKRSRNAWSFYAQGQIRKQVQDANPGASLKVVMGLLSRQFKALSPSERAIYNDMAAADKVRFETELAELARNAAVQSIEA